MSTENRNKVLLGFGGLVVVLVVAIALWPPNFRKEDASGAIGAVQKHHAPQITQKDVILGGEKTKHQQKVLYADFLADASKLQGVSTELRAADASARITAVRGELAALDGELNVRYAEEFSLALAEAEAASRNMHRATLDDELNQMQSFLAAHRTNLSDTDMVQLNGKLSHAVDQMNVRTQLRILEDADTQVAGAAAQLARKNLSEAMNELDHAAKELKDADMATRVTLSDEIAFLAEIETEVKTVADAELVLNNDDFATASSNLAARGVELDQRAATNLKTTLDNDNEVAAKFKDIDGQLVTCARAVPMQSAMVDSAAALARSVDAARASVQGVEAEFNVRLSMAPQLQNDMMAARKTLDTRSQ